MTPMEFLEMHAALMHGANLHIVTEEREAEHLVGDQTSLAPFERVSLMWLPGTRMKYHHTRMAL